MKTTINKETFIKAFTDYNRKDAFTYNGLVTLYDYFTQLEEETGIDMELDVIDICCNYTEYSNWEEFEEEHTDTAQEIGNSFEEDTDINDLLSKLRDYTNVINVEGESFIIQNF